MHWSSTQFRLSCFFSSKKFLLFCRPSIAKESLQETVLFVAIFRERRGEISTTRAEIIPSWKIERAKWACFNLMGTLPIFLVNFYITFWSAFGKSPSATICHSDTWPICQLSPNIGRNASSLVSPCRNPTLVGKKYAKMNLGFVYMAKFDRNLQVVENLKGTHAWTEIKALLCCTFFLLLYKAKERNLAPLYSM